MVFRSYLFSSRHVGILVCFAVSTVAREAIIHGHPVFHTYQFPYQVSVQNHQRHHVCGGSVISHRFVLTAANCVISHHHQFVAGHHYILVGTTDFNVTAAPAEAVRVKRIYVPKAYSPRGYAADIALLQVQHKLKNFTRNNDFLRLPKPDLRIDLNNKNGVITGFGWNHVDLGGMTGSTDGQLRYAGVQILVGKACEEHYSPGTINSERHICARMSVEDPETVRYFGAGEGDEGAPLVVGHDQIPVIVGILIRRSPSCDEEDFRGYPGIYTRVSHYRTFIDDVLKGNNSTDILRHFA